MYPITPALTRMVINSFEFEGYSVPAAEQVIVTTTVPHYFPEFFLRQSISILNATRLELCTQATWGVRPFGLGTHRYLAADFTAVANAVTMATIVQETHLKLDPLDYKLKINPVSLPGHDD